MALLCLFSYVEQQRGTSQLRRCGKAANTSRWKAPACTDDAEVLHCHKANEHNILAVNPRRCFGALEKSRKQFSLERLSPTTGAEGGSEPPLDLQRQEGSGTSRSE